MNKVNRVEPWKSSFLSGLLITYVSSFSFDFKGSEGGVLAQLLMVFYVLFAVVGILVFGQARFPKSLLRAIIVTVLIALLGSTMALINEVDIDRIARIALPFVLLISGLWIGGVASATLRHARLIVIGMAVAGLVSVLFRYLYAVRISGMVVDEMRYQILSPALIFLMAYVYARLSVFRTLSVFVFFVIVTSVIVILVSLTRSYVISVVFLMVGGSFLTWRLDPRNRWADLFSVRRFLVLTSAVFAGAFGLAAANVIRPDIIESWQARLFADQALTSSGSDVNLVSRIAEASGIWNQTMESPRSAIFGSGFGNLYQWDYTFAGEVSSVSVEMVYAFFAPTWSMAHSPFTYALFFGGAVGLLWQLWFFIYPLAVGVRNLPSFIGSDQREVRFLYVFCMLAIWLCVSQSLTSNPLGERMSAQFLGVVIGLLFGVVARVRNLN